MWICLKIQLVLCVFEFVNVVKYLRIHVESVLTQLHSNKVMYLIAQVIAFRIKIGISRPLDGDDPIACNVSAVNDSRILYSDNDYKNLSYIEIEDEYAGTTAKIVL